MTTSRDLALLAAQTASSKQGQDIVVLDVSELITITDYFVIVSGTSSRHLDTLSEEIQRALRDHGARPVRREGEPAAGWLLLDYVDFVVHVFAEEARDFYRLENLWRDAPVVDVEDEPEASSG